MTLGGDESKRIVFIHRCMQVDRYPPRDSGEFGMLLTPPHFVRLALGLGLLIGLVGSAPVRAIDITFDLSSGVSGLSTVTKTVSGYTMT